MSGESFVPSMISISNRNVIERMKKWGWREGKVKADKVLMEAPNGAKIEMMRPGIHQGNSKSTFQNLLSIMEMSWEQFITPLDPEAQGVLDWYVTLSGDEQERYKDHLKLIDALDKKRMEDHQRDISRRANIEKRKRREAEKKARTFPVQVTKIDIPKPAPPKKEEVVVVPEEPLSADAEPTLTKVAERTTGITNRILMLLIESQQPMSLDAIHKQMPDARRDTLSQSCANLMRYGVVDRVKPGVYKIKEEARKRGDVQVDIVARSGPPLAEVTSGPVKSTETDVKPETTLPSPPVPVVTSPQAPVVADKDYDEMINETLDLLFPEGFKARHLPMIDTWRQATLWLLRDVNKDR